MRLMDLLKPDAGQVLIDSVPTSDLRTSELARRVGFCSRTPTARSAAARCARAAAVRLQSAGAGRTGADSRVDAIVEEFAFDPRRPVPVEPRPPAAGAGVHRECSAPPVVVLDEPTTGLDYRECVKVMDIIRRIHERGTTVVMVCHDMEVVADYAARCIVMSGGEVVDDAPTFDVLRNRETLERASARPPPDRGLSLGAGPRMPRLADEPSAAPTRWTRWPRPSWRKFGRAKGACAHELVSGIRARHQSAASHEPGGQAGGGRLAFALACFCSSNLAFLAVLLAAGFALAATCGMVKPAIGLAKAVFAFSLILAVVQVLTAPSGAVLVELPWGYVGTGSLLAALTTVVRLVAAAIPLCSSCSTSPR